MEAAHIMRETSDSQVKIVSLLRLMLDHSGGEEGRICGWQQQDKKWSVEYKTSTPAYRPSVSFSAADATAYLYDQPTVPLSILRVIRTSNSMLILTQDELRTDPDFAEDLYFQSMKEPPQALMALPMLLNGQLTGVLIMSSFSQQTAFTNASVPLLQMISAQVSLLMQQQRLSSSASVSSSSSVSSGSSLDASQCLYPRC